MHKRPLGGAHDREMYAQASAVSPAEVRPPDRAQASTSCGVRPLPVGASFSSAFSSRLLQYSITASGLGGERPFATEGDSRAPKESFLRGESMMFRAVTEPRCVVVSRQVCCCAATCMWCCRGSPSGAASQAGYAMSRILLPVVGRW
jgi:hypothetical protein